MGNTQAIGMADAVDDGLIDLTTALDYHLQHNHYPPVPTSMIPVCIRTIELANDDDYDALVDLPDGCYYKNMTAAPVWAIAEQHHLTHFINDPEEDNTWPDDWEDEE